MTDVQQDVEHALRRERSRDERIASRPTGALLSDRAGVVTASAIANMQARDMRPRWES